MFKFCSLYSGSSGNSLFIETNNTKILIDAGESAKKIEAALNQINVDANEIDAILVTHEHSDHIKGIATLSKKFNLPVYANQETWDAMPEIEEKIQQQNKILFNVDEQFDVGDLKVIPFSTPHDAANSCGFNILHNDNKISIATDLGHIDSKIIKKLEDSIFILLESNYDPNILSCSKYPYLLKKRIAGPNGHLSNEAAGKTIAHLLNSGLKSVMLGHLSKENNFPELAYKTVIDELCSQNFDENKVKIEVAKRSMPSSILDLEVS